MLFNALRPMTILKRLEKTIDKSVDIIYLSHLKIHKINRGFVKNKCLADISCSRYIFFQSKDWFCFSYSEGWYTLGGDFLFR